MTRLTGGTRLERSNEGYFLAPALFVDITAASMPIISLEILVRSPVLNVSQWLRRCPAATEQDDERVAIFGSQSRRYTGRD